jgi:hypothetical protein
MRDALEEYGGLFLAVRVGPRWICNMLRIHVVIVPYT